eukprot:8964-Heterococcus_DN1.PRE.2
MNSAWHSVVTLISLRLKHVMAVTKATIIETSITAVRSSSSTCPRGIAALFDAKNGDRYAAKTVTFAAQLKLKQAGGSPPCALLGLIITFDERLSYIEAELAMLYPRSDEGTL